ncbi:hypothetical protein AOQ84DRAFT_376227 [Glonium stellatum]|uniref:Uncharacterized protein n=1 Tax=Glonium stellatum TaxID=574774 RepID=A0A8E2F1T2_9PEZI|nr:hypothetical protein AOQ84DRAFT_376227 [Glonium stellatum]
MRNPLWTLATSVSLITVQASSAQSVPTITVIASLPESGVPGALIGSEYVPDLGASTTYYCPPGQIWSTEGRYAACCNNVPYVECPIAVSCVSTSLLVGPDGVWTSECSGASLESVCITGLVYLSTGGTAAITNVQCWALWAGGTWKATKLATAAASTLITTISSGPPGVASPTVKPATSLTVPIQTAQPTEQSSPRPVGAIIGGVIGGLTLVLLALGLCFWYIYLRTTQENSSHRPSSPEVGQPSEIAANELAAEVDDEPNAGRLIEELLVEPTGFTNAVTRDEDAESAIAESLVSALTQQEPSEQREDN